MYFGVKIYGGYNFFFMWVVVVMFGYDVVCFYFVVLGNQVVYYVVEVMGCVDVYEI